MNVFRRAILYLIRKKTRSILLFLLLFFMGLFMLSGLTIRRSAGQAAADMQKSISSGLEIKMDAVSGDKIYTLSHNKDGELVRTLKYPLITESVAKELASVPGVSGYYSEQGAETLYTGLDVAPGLYTESLKRLAENEETAEPEYITSSRIWSRANDFHIVQESEYYPYFRNGALELSAGRHLHLEDTGKILISDELAAKNGLTVGDTIDGQNFDFITGELYGELYHAEIVGIFHINFEQQGSEWMSEPDLLSNTIFAPFEMRYWGQYQSNTFYGKDVLAKEEDRLLGSVTFFVKDPAELDKIEAQIKENEHVDWSYYTIQRYDADYKAAAKPLLSMKLFASAMVAVIIAGTLLILSLVLTMWIRDRKQETNVLLSLGVNGRMILAQFLIEMGVLIIAAFLLSSLFAFPVTRTIGNTMTELTNPPEKTESFTTKYEATTGITYINRTPVRQEALSYQISGGAVTATFLSMIFVSFGTVIWAYRAMQKNAFVSQKGLRIHHRDLPMLRGKGVMKAHHRAFLYVTRKTGKSTLLLLLLFAIMGLLLSGISIRTASENAAARLRENFDGYFKIVPDRQKSEAAGQIDQARIAHITELIDAQAANAMDVCYMDVRDLSLNPGKFSAENDEKAGMARILGNTDSSLHEYFSLELLTLTAGKHIAGSDAGKALISGELAARNRLKPGDHFTISTPAEDIRNGVLQKTYDLEIAGLFSEKQPAFGSLSHTPECDIPSNFIFTDISTTQQIMRDMHPERKQAYSGGALFFVKDPETLEDAVLTIEEAGMIDHDLMGLTINNAAYQKSMEPLNRLRSMSFLLLALIAGGGVILLTLILTLWERDRIHETGILMSFGIRKCNIWWQRLLECASVFLLSLIISVILFLPVVTKIGGLLYEQASSKAEQTAQQDAEAPPIMQDAMDTASSGHEIIFQAKLSPDVILFSALAGLIVTEGAMSITFFLSARHKPRELLAMME